MTIFATPYETSSGHFFIVGCPNLRPTTAYGLIVEGDQEPFVIKEGLEYELDAQQAGKEWAVNH